MNTKRERTAGRIIMVLVMITVLMATGSFPAMAGGSAKADVGQNRGMESVNHLRPALGIWRDQQMVQKLELTEKQVKKLRDADFASREKRLVLKAQLNHLYLEMDKVFSAETVDREAVRQLTEKIPDVKGNLIIQYIDSCLAIGKILNADQINKLKQLSRQQKKQIPRAGRKGDATKDSV